MHTIAGKFQWNKMQTVKFFNFTGFQFHIMLRIKYVWVLLSKFNFDSAQGFPAIQYFVATLQLL